MFGRCFKIGSGGDFKAKSDNGLLGLEEENLDEVVGRVVEQ